MSEPLFLITPIASDAPGLPEQLGTKEKYWIMHEGSYHLIKFGRVGTGEDWAEKAVSEICDLIGLPHAHYDLAICADRSCVISPNFIPSDGRLVHGNELISTIVKQYDGTRIYRQKEHTVSRVVAALIVSTRPFHVETIAQFTGYLMLDAWVGNTDRHHENWGLVRDRAGKVTLAPTYDHASSLGRELSDDERTKRLDTKDQRFSVGAFVTKARSALYDSTSDKKSLTTMQAFTEVAKLHAPAARDWLTRLAQVDDSALLAVFDRFPPTILSNPSKRFALEVLRANRSLLLNLRRA